MITQRYYNCAIACIYTLLLLMPQLRYASLNGCLFDLGVLDGMIAHAISTPSRMLMGHIHPIGWLYGVISLAAGNFTPYVLLVLQSATLIFCIHLIRVSTDRLTALLFALHPAIWWHAINGFHFDHIAVLAIVLFYHFYVRQHYTKALIAALCTILAKETFSLFIMPAGLLLLATPWLGGTKKSWVFGVVALVFGLLYFIFSTHYFLPLTYGSGTTQMSGNAFGWLGGSITETIITLITRPLYVISEVLSDPRRLIFFIVLMGGYAFIIWRALWLFIPILPLLLIPALSKDPLYYSYGGQYMAPLAVACAYIFYKTHPYILRFSPRFISLGVIGCALLIHVVFSPSILSRTFLSERQSAFNYHNYITDERSAVIKDALIQHADLFAGKIVSTQNSVYYYPMRYAERLVSFPQAIQTPHSFFVLKWDTQQNIIHHPETRAFADIIIIDTKRAKFLIDRGCNFQYGRCTDTVVENDFDALAMWALAHYKIIYEYDGFFILIRP